MDECFPSLLAGGARTLYIRPFVFKSLRTGSTSFLFPWTLWIIPCHLQNERFICIFLHRSLDSLVDTVVVTTSQHHTCNGILLRHNLNRARDSMMEVVRQIYKQSLANRENKKANYRAKNIRELEKVLGRLTQ